MLLEFILAITFGIFAGIFTGLIPGIHVNLISASLVSLSAFFLSFTGPLPLSCFIIALATTHSFLDVLPSVFLGAPESSTALGVLPGHRFVLRGEGVLAVKLTLIGSLLVLVLCAFLFPLLIPFVSFIYPLISKLIVPLLLLIVIFMLLRESRPVHAFFVFALAGTLGFFVLNSVAIRNPLFPLLSGLFGTATLLTSLNDSSHLPKQKSNPFTSLSLPKSLSASISATVSGFITAVLPGIGAGTAAVMSAQVSKDLGDDGFLMLIGGIGTSNFVLSLVTFLSLNKARNGALVAVQSLLENVSLPEVLVFLCVSFVAGGASVVLALFFAQKFSVLMNKLSYKKLVLSVIMLICVLTPLLSGLKGILILITATAIGILPSILKVSRTHAMACLLVPVIIYFL